MSNIGKIDGVRLKVVDDEITVNVTTDEQLTTLTPEQLEALGITARQFVEERETVSQELTTKANLDMDNISNVGKSTISGLGMPSASWEALSITSGKAPKNGLLKVQGVSGSNNNRALIIVTTSTGVYQSTVANASTGIIVPVLMSTDENYTITVDNSTVTFARFYYAQGELD